MQGRAQFSSSWDSSFSFTPPASLVLLALPPNYCLSYHSTTCLAATSQLYPDLSRVSPPLNLPAACGQGSLHGSSSRLPSSISPTSHPLLTLALLDHQDLPFLSLPVLTKPHPPGIPFHLPATPQLTPMHLPLKVLSNLPSSWKPSLII